MHLRANETHEVPVAACDNVFSFVAGETIHTECSYKYTPESIADIASQTGFRVREMFTDDKKWFALALFTPA